MQQLIFTPDPAQVLANEIERIAPKGGVFALCDTNTERLVYPILAGKCRPLRRATVITVKAGDDHKTLEALTHIWQELQSHGATRHSLLVNIGGGMVTDMGGLAAATFKRGMRFINMPTTLLGAVDAAVGGKTGINFNGLKNEIGVFAEADAVVISTVFFATLPREELLSGYGEMLKHSLLQSREEILALTDRDVADISQNQLLEMLQRSVAVKQAIVAQDPHEQGLRKALNLGHTFGHALESWHMEEKRPVPHGYAVAWGLVCALVLSHLQLKFDSTLLRRVAQYIEQNYGAPRINCTHYPRLIELMRHDKKNADAQHIRFTLLSVPGAPLTECEATESDIKTTLDLMRDLLHV